MQEHRSVQGSFDLHMHSVYSDGSQSVQTLITEARERGLSGIAVTDHDSLRQLSSVRAEARKIHILCYGLAATADESGPLELLVNETLARRTANTLWQAWTLERTGIAPCGRKASVADVVEVSRASTGVYKQHVMQALTGLGYRDGEYQRVYRRLFKNGGIAERDISYPDALAIVRAAREQGGVPVLAHPQQMDSWGAIPALVKAGLMGIEAFHPDNDAVATEEAFRLARQYGILCTGGSDYHGRYGAPECVGACFITPDEAGESVAQLFDQERLLA